MTDIQPSLRHVYRNKRDTNQIDDDTIRVGELLQIFHEHMNSPLYATILADTSDLEVASFAQNYREEIDAITANDCCFFFFRDLDSAAKLNAFDFSEHVLHVYPLAKLIGIDFNKLPCFLFFRRIDSGQYVYISLAGQRSANEILILFRQMFAYMHRRKELSPLEQLKKFKHSQSIEVTREAVLQNATQIGRDLFESFLLSLFHAVK